MDEAPAVVGALETIAAGPSIEARSLHPLDDSYEQAIRVCCEDDDNVHNVLSIVIVSETPQFPQSMSDILGIHNTLTIRVISLFQDILKLQDGRVHPADSSLRDYLLDPRRCEPTHPWFINENEEHRLMAIRCIHYLDKTLSRNGRTSFLQSRLFHEALPDAFIYTTISWVYHVCMVIPSAELGDKIYSFLSKHFLHWLEALSILGRSRSAIDWLDQLQDWHSGSHSLPGFDPSFQAMLYDGWRFVKTFSKTIESDPSLVYTTALPFCPKNAGISTMFNRDPAVSVVSGCLQHWSPSLMTLSGCSMQVATLSVSKSGDAIAAGCVDGHLKVWNARLGSEIFTIEGAETHVVDTYGLIYTQFTSDGTRLLCGMLKGDIYLLDADTGNIRTTLNVRDGGYGKKTKLYCVGLAPDDRTVVCGFQDGMIQIWDTESQVQLTPLWVGHDSGVNCVAFSHDQQKVISCSDDCTIHLWSPIGVHERTMLGHTESVHCVVFSPDDARIASASVDETMKIWDALTGSLLLTCRHSPDEAVYSVAFSNKGDRLATGTHHCKIRIWDSETGQEVMPPLSLHQGPIRALTFAPDDKTIISGSKDQHVRVWSLANMPPYASVQPCHTDEVNCVALSHDKTRFVSGARDNLVIMWNTMDGCAVFPPLQGHAEVDGLICFWDAATGKSQGFPLILTEEIMLMKFSPSGSKIVVITKENALAVWSIPDRSVLFRSAAISDPLPLGCRCVFALTIPDWLSLMITPRTRRYSSAWASQSSTRCKAPSCATGHSIPS
ncbi:quinon protein alcohol dehydrogenase-like superfamily [Mycena vulgaris]|nr:quinon protein alcohol dehydrogenase-like superfamily [Mycena vulgaris]